MEKERLNFWSFSLSYLSDIEVLEARC